MPKVMCGVCEAVVVEITTDYQERKTDCNNACA